MPVIEHVQNNKSVREILGKRGIKPEELSPAEDIKKLEKRVINDEKQIEQKIENNYYFCTLNKINKNQ
jgi:DNA-damage-inducible protein D